MPLLLVFVLVTVGGCYWISGPWTGRDTIEDRFEEIEIGMLQEEVDDILGDPSEFKYVTAKDGSIPEGSKAAHLLYKYDYPTDPLLITVKVDYFGIVTEKHFDDTETVSKLAAKKSYEEKLSYPGAPQRRFRELLKKKAKEGKTTH